MTEAERLSRAVALARQLERAQRAVEAFFDRAGGTRQIERSPGTWKKLLARRDRLVTELRAIGIDLFHLDGAQLSAARISNVVEMLAQYRDAQRASERASDARASLAPGSSRARVTTANARWMRASEHRNRLEARVRELGVNAHASVVRGDAIDLPAAK